MEDVKDWDIRNCLNEEDKPFIIFDEFTGETITMSVKEVEIIRKHFSRVMEGIYSYETETTQELVERFMNAVFK